MKPRRSALRALVCSALIFLAASSGHADAVITVINLDGADEGFNDATPAAPIDGNPGTTIGQQRLNVFQAAADAWGETIGSNVPVLVDASWDALECGEEGTTLGHAGPIVFGRTTHPDDIPGLLMNTWYPIALVNALAGKDLDPGRSDVVATFNSDVDTNPECAPGLTWWYGLTGSAPANQIGFMSTVLHELAHGLGFLSLVSLETGKKAEGVDDIYSNMLEDHDLGQLWPDMTDAQRLASATNTGNLHWVGPQVVAKSLATHAVGIHPSGHVQMYAPTEISGGSSVSHWDTELFPNELMEPQVTATHIQTLSEKLLWDIGWPLTVGQPPPPPGTGDCPHGTFSVSQTGEVCSLRAYFCGKSSKIGRAHV